MTTHELLDELTRLDGLATKGDWTMDGPMICGADSTTDVQGYTVGRVPVAGLVNRFSINLTTKEAELNADLIVLLRNNLPAILEALRKTEALDALVAREPWKCGRCGAIPEHGDRHSPECDAGCI